MTFFNKYDLVFGQRLRLAPYLFQVMVDVCHVELIFKLLSFAFQMLSYRTKRSGKAS